MKASIRGRQYAIRFKAIRSLNGSCESGSPPREIVIRKSLTGQPLLDTLIHEMLHAAFEDMCEAAVEETAGDISTVLWRLGWRPREAIE